LAKKTAVFYGGRFFAKKTTFGELGGVLEYAFLAKRKTAQRRIIPW
jgi:hypothetical protein